MLLEKIEMVTLEVKKKIGFTKKKGLLGLKKYSLGLLEFF